MGRPKKSREFRRCESVTLYLTPAEMQAWSEAADRERKIVIDWAREILHHHATSNGHKTKNKAV